MWLVTPSGVNMRKPLYFIKPMPVKRRRFDTDTSVYWALWKWKSASQGVLAGYRPVRGFTDKRYAVARRRGLLAKQARKVQR